MTQKRVNKTKEEIKADMVRTEKVEKEKQIVRLLFPLLENLPTIYDGQTAVNALSGYIKYEISVREAELKVSDLNIDLTNEKESEIKTAVAKLLELVKNDGAKDMASLLERVGTALAQYSAAQFLKNPMSSVKVTDIVAK